jgi:hypothetical protein
MKTILILALLSSVIESAPSSTPASSRQSGIAKYYSPGVMEAVARKRGLARTGSVQGMAAVPNCGHIGKVAVAAINGRSAERYLIVDCSSPRDRAKHVRQGLVIEVDYSSAVRNGFQRRGSAPATVISIGKN